MAVEHTDDRKRLVQEIGVTQGQGRPGFSSYLSMGSETGNSSIRSYCQVASCKVLRELTLCPL
jgi:hypothetical protein